VADTRSDGQVERWISFATTIIAPATVLSALLFYFGYVSSRAQYDYFGVDVDTIGLGTRDYVMRSPQPLLFPLLVLTLIGIGALLVHAEIRRRIAAAPPDARGPRQLAQYRRFARRAVVSGLVLLGAGIALLVSYPYVREWSFFNLVTPLLLAIGSAVVAYASRIQSLLQVPTPVPVPGRDQLTPTARAYATTAASTDGSQLSETVSFARRPAEDASTTGAPLPSAQAATEHAASSMVALRRSAGVLIFVVIVANIFWATATIAQWSGRGVAHYNATHLDRLPQVILDTQERLFLHDPGVEETVLPASAGQTFHYRYRHLRLLIQGHDRMFLVPEHWSASDSTLIVPLDGSVRVQFQFVNVAP
jgi:hypothetical protein